MLFSLILRLLFGPEDPMEGYAPIASPPAPPVAT